MSNWRLFRLSLANHPGLTIGWMWIVMTAGAALSRPETPPLSFWLIVFPALAAMPWIPILCTAWSGRKQYMRIQIMNDQIAPKATQHQIDSMLRLADLPNQLGYKFVGITRGWTAVELEIVEREDCAFSVSDEMYPYLLGWVKP